jgi:DNA gyrase subunit A
MTPYASTIQTIHIDQELRSSYLDYSMSVIIGRALPDVRDGLKPVHRRILYAMHREGLTAERKHQKCAGVVGEVLKKYHPHGDTAVYDALVRMAQPWNLRYPLVDGQGNFGSIDGDPAAAYRYTECRMTRLAGDLLVDIDKETVSFSPNFDGTTEEPDVLPAAFPNLLVNGAEGIAVGMATKIPPHNLAEIVAACVALVERPDLSDDELFALVPGPDFPTGGTIHGRAGIREAYRTGRGRLIVRGRAQFEDLPNGRTAIIIDELPYQVNKARLVEQIADLVRGRKIEGIAALRDESDRQGMRVVVELRHDAQAEIVRNALYKHTPLQTTFGVILLSIVGRRPRVLSLREMVQHYIAHRREVTLRRLQFDLRKARERAHVLEGFRIALDALDLVIALIRGSADADTAREALMARVGLDRVQADAVLDLRLQRLTGLERDKIEDERQKTLALIAQIEAIVSREAALMNVVREELVEIGTRYQDDRRTQIVEATGDVSLLDLVAEEHQVVTLSHLGYIKRCPTDEWRRQARGGAGKLGMDTREEDFVTSLFLAHTHGTLLVFTHSGRVFPLPVVEVPEAGRAARGRPIVNLVDVGEDKVASVLGIRDLEEPEGGGGRWLLFVSAQGVVKRTRLSEFRNLRAGGLIATHVGEGDAIVCVLLLEGTDCSLMLLTRGGRCIRFPMDQVPELLRPSRGVRGIQVGEGDVVVDAVILPASEVADDEGDDEAAGEEEVVSDGPALLTVTASGFGKRTPIDQYRAQNRRGKGKLSFRTTSKTGEVVRAMTVTEADEMMLATDRGRVIRIAASTVRLSGRVTQGVRLMRLDAGEAIVDLARIVEDDDPTAEVDLVEEALGDPVSEDPSE